MLIKNVALGNFLLPRFCSLYVLRVVDGSLVFGGLLPLRARSPVNFQWILTILVANIISKSKGQVCFPMSLFSLPLCFRHLVKHQVISLTLCMFCFVNLISIVKALCRQIFNFDLSLSSKKIPTVLISLLPNFTQHHCGEGAKFRFENWFST